MKKYLLVLIITLLMANVASAIPPNPIPSWSSITGIPANLPNGPVVPPDTSNKVMNGTAWTGATGGTPPNSWIVVNAGVFSIVAGPHLQIAVDSVPTSNPSITQMIPTISGHVYSFRYRFQKGTAASGSVMVGSTAGGNQYYLSGTLTSSSYDGAGKIFKATGTSAYITLQTTSSVTGQTGLFDAVSFSEIGTQQSNQYCTNGVCTTDIVGSLGELIPSMYLASSDIIFSQGVNASDPILNSNKYLSNIWIGVGLPGGFTLPPTGQMQFNIWVGDTAGYMGSMTAASILGNILLDPLGVVTLDPAAAEMTNNVIINGGGDGNSALPQNFTVGGTHGTLINGTPPSYYGGSNDITNYTNLGETFLSFDRVHSVLGLSQGTGYTPTITSGACGTGSNGTITAGGNDQSFKVNIGSAATSTCTVTFATTYPLGYPRSCIFSPANSTAAAQAATVYISTLNRTTVVLSGTVLANTAYYLQCQ